MTVFGETAPEYWSIFRNITPQKLREAKQFLTRNKIEIIDSRMEPDEDMWCPDSQRKFYLRFRSRAEAEYFRYTFDVAKPRVPCDADTRYDHPWRTKEMFRPSTRSTRRASSSHAHC